MRTWIEAGLALCKHSQLFRYRDKVISQINVCLCSGGHSLEGSDISVACGKTVYRNMSWEYLNPVLQSQEGLPGEVHGKPRHEGVS